MSKTEKTKKLENLLAHHFKNNSEFFTFETTIGWIGKEIVDCIMYNHERNTYCYEIKQSKADFYSKNALTFIGNFNYFVMPYELYEKVKQDIPIKIGCYVSIKHENTKGYNLDQWNEYNLRRQKGIYENGFDELVCIRKSFRQELKADKEVILSSMLRSMQRDRYNFIREENKILEEA